MTRKDEFFMWTSNILRVERLASRIAVLEDTLTDLDNKIKLNEINGITLNPELGEFLCEEYNDTYAQKLDLEIEKNEFEHTILELQKKWITAE